MSGFSRNGAKSIAQTHNGILYRSRTEARWAEYFHLCGIDFQYEPEGYDLGNGDFYVPDFYLQYSGVFFEVKFGRPNSREMRVADALSFVIQAPVVIAQGNPWQRVALTGLKPGLGWNNVSLMSSASCRGAWLCFPHSSMRLSPLSVGRPDCIDLRLAQAGKLQFQGARDHASNLNWKERRRPSVPTIL